MISQWEIFNGGPTEPRNERLHVTLSHRGVILINGNVHERLGKPDAVLLMFDRLNSIIGLRPDPAASSNAFPVALKGKGRHRLIRAKPFCRHYGIEISGTRTFIGVDVDNEGVLRLDLKRTTEISRKVEPRPSPEPAA